MFEKNLLCNVLCGALFSNTLQWVFKIQIQCYSQPNPASKTGEIDSRFLQEYIYGL